MDQDKIYQLRNLHALLSQSNPELIKQFQNHMPDHEVIAAKLISASHLYSTTVAVTTIGENTYEFLLNLNSKIYQSKSNWIWINHLEVVAPHMSILKLSINPRVIDMPYSGNQICAYWLFKNFHMEIKEHLSTYL